MTRVHVVQLAPRLGDLAANACQVCQAVASSLAAGADVIVLPELATSGYVFTSEQEARAAAITTEHPLFGTLTELLAQRPGAVAVVGFAQADGGQVFNSAAVLDDTGILGIYRKVHLWDRERLWFTPGDDQPLVLDTTHGRLGVMICFDLEFPEWTRLAALAGTDLLLVPTNWPLLAPATDGQLPEVTIASATARMNQMAIAFADRCGTEREVAWSQGSGIVDAAGRLVASVGQGSGAASAEIDLSASRDKTQGSLTDIFGDRRPDLYAGLCAPHPAQPTG